MKRLSAILPALAIFAFLPAAPTAAAPALVAPREAVGNPAFAGDEIVYAAETSKGSEIRAVAPGGSTRVLGRLEIGPSAPDPFDEGFGGFSALTFELRGSGRAVGVLGQDQRGDRYSYSVYRRAALGGRAGPLTPFEPHCEMDRPPAHPALDVDGPRVAFVVETCTSGRATAHRATIRDVTTGVETAGPATATSAVRLAGRYLAYRPDEEPGAVAVYDLETQQVVKTVAGAGSRFDVQADGKLAEGPAPGTTTTGCTRGVRWHALGDDHQRVIAGCDSALIAIDGDHIGLWRQSHRGLAVATLDGGAREVNVPGTLADEPDLSGNRIVFSTRGCSRDTGGVWVDDGTDPSVLIPELPECRARPPRGPLSVDRRGRVAVPVSCPSGCRGGIELTAGRRYSRVIGLGDFFEVPAGKPRNVHVDVGFLRRQFKGRRSILMRVEIRVNTRDQGSYTRVVRVVRLKI